MKKNIKINIQQLNYYNKFINTESLNFKQVGWGSAASQEKRFKILLKYLNTKNYYSLLDVGSGNSDLLSFFKKKKIRKINYTGIDLNEYFINKSKKKHKKINLICGDYFKTKFKKKFDIIFVSGLLNLNNSQGLQRIKKIIKKSFDECRKMVVINILSSYARNKSKKFFYAKPSFIIKILKKDFKKFIIDHSYFEHDFTLVLFK